ncbi:uncharacterized protein LOC114560597 isoform X2 [Perca flavescens]|uniref:uncharacterized protein LOC114560597 isoform X2 n=1 Tax=Perca flavescens TaxID=8167 RepID=UPI00106E9EC0|nr:uncharacterized protein LOC114560597 isoform X2 [Perca flavescens]
MAAAIPMFEDRQLGPEGPTCQLTLKQKSGSAGSDSDWSKEQLQTSDDEPGPSDTMTAEPDYLEWVSGFVSTNSPQTFILKNPAGARLKIGGLEDTIYKGNDEELNRWGNFYLPKIVNMKVVGVVEETSCPYDHLVLMTCEDRKVYAFDGEEEELHMVAESLEKLGEEGLTFPSSQSYYKGEAFKDMTKEDWDKVRNSEEGKKLDEEHRKLVEEKKSELLKKLKSTKVAAAAQSCSLNCFH